jgi:hypothetical protein
MTMRVIIASCDEGPWLAWAGAFVGCILDNSHGGSDDAAAIVDMGWKYHGRKYC